jgi:glucose dehydrogenase
MPNRATLISVVLVLLLGIPASAQTIPRSGAESVAAFAKGEWPAYGGTYAAARHSPLDQINSRNAKNLHWLGAGDLLTRPSIRQIRQ